MHTRNGSLQTAASSDWRGNMLYELPSAQGQKIHQTPIFDMFFFRPSRFECIRVTNHNKSIYNDNLLPIDALESIIISEVPPHRARPTPADVLHNGVSFP